MTALAAHAAPVLVVGRLTAFDIGIRISLQSDGQRVVGELIEVEHKRELFGGTTKTKVWLRTPGWSSFVQLDPATEYEVAR